MSTIILSVQCTKAIIDNSKKPWAIPIIKTSQFIKAMSIIFDKFFRCFGKFSKCLKRFFLLVKLQKCFCRFFKKREQFTDSAVSLNKKERFF